MTENSNGKKFSKNAVLERLQELEMKKNKCRVDSRNAIDDEYKRDTEGEKGRQKREKKEAEEKQEKFKESLREDGIDVERYLRLHDTQEIEDQKMKKKSKRCEAGEIDVEGEEAQYRAFKKRKNKIQFDQAEYQKQKEELGSDFYDATALPVNGLQRKDSASAIHAVKDELEDSITRRGEFSRRRAYSEDGDINFINERNRKFSQKAARAYDPYTAVIRDNLERGTAL
jgi:pre-mRNA-splicing factor SYF2